MNNTTNERIEKEQNWNTLKSQAAKFIGTASLVAALIAGWINSADAQTLVNKKWLKKAVNDAKKSQDEIGENMAKFVFGGWIEKWLQLEINKQNSKHWKTYESEKFSIFKDKDVKNVDDTTTKIFNKQEMKDTLHGVIDSMATKDVATYFLAFKAYQNAGTGLIGSRKEKVQEKIGGNWWNNIGFATDEFIDFLDNNKWLPFSKKQQIEIKAFFEWIYEKELSAWKKDALEKRQSMDKATWESAILLTLEVARQNIVKQICTYVDGIVDKAFIQFFNQSNDAPVSNGYIAPQNTTGKNVPTKIGNVQNKSKWGKYKYRR